VQFASVEDRENEETERERESVFLLKCHVELPSGTIENNKTNSIVVHAHPHGCIYSGVEKILRLLSFEAVANQLAPSLNLIAVTSLE